MATPSFEKSNLGWEVQQLQQRLEEWLEYQFASLNTAPWSPEVNLPPWFPRAVFWVILGTVMIGMTLRLLQPLQAYWATRRARNRRSVTLSKPGVARPPSVATWFQQAQALARQENYPEACRALYMAMLQHLSDTKNIPQQPHRTDGEYRQLVQGLPHPQPYLALLTTHEQVCFGECLISLATYHDCRQALWDLEQS